MLPYSVCAYAEPHRWEMLAWGECQGQLPYKVVPHQDGGECCHWYGFTSTQVLCFLVHSKSSKCWHLSCRQILEWALYSRCSSCQHTEISQYHAPFAAGKGVPNRLSRKKDFTRKLRSSDIPSTDDAFQHFSSMGAGSQSLAHLALIL